MNIQPGEIGHIIQLSIAPVFLLTGVGTNMLVLTNRLAVAVLDVGGTTSAPDSTLV